MITRVLITLMLGLATVGCSGGAGASTFPVSGKVTYQGKTLTHGTIMFSPLDATQPSSRGAIQPDGTYRLTLTQDAEGAVAGEHRVIVNSLTPGVAGLEVGEAKQGRPRSLIPIEYSSFSTTPLTRTVTSDQNLIDIEL